MATNVRDTMKGLCPARRKKIEARTATLIAEEMSLRDLRQALTLTQERIAESLGIGQDGVSRLEKRSDLLLSTLRTYVEAMGGQLSLYRRFPRPRRLLRSPACPPWKRISILPRAHAVASAHGNTRPDHNGRLSSVPTWPSPSDVCVLVTPFDEADRLSPARHSVLARGRKRGQVLFQSQESIQTVGSFFLTVAECATGPRPFGGTAGTPDGEAIRVEVLTVRPRGRPRGS